jgi:hypothetical protein
MGTPKLLSTSLNSLTGTDTGSIYVNFSEPMAYVQAEISGNYNFSPSLTITGTNGPLVPEVWFKMDEGPGTSETDPTNSGNIVSSSVVRILDIS